MTEEVAGGERSDAEREARALRRFARSFASPDSYGLVLLLILVTYVLATTLSARAGASILIVVQIGTVGLALRTSHARRGFNRVARVLLVVAAVAAVTNLFVTKDWMLSLAFAASCFLYFVAPVSIVRHIAWRRQVDQETMLGALSAYLLIGMAFGFLYVVVGRVQGSPFFGTPAGDGTVSQTLFFSFVTLTTTGYGNLVPAGNPGQTLAVFEALIGQLFLVTGVAKIVNAWVPRGWVQGKVSRPGPTPEDASGPADDGEPGADPPSVTG
jgi:hypothetical protein